MAVGLGEAGHDLDLVRVELVSRLGVPRAGFTVALVLFYMIALCLVIIVVVRQEVLLV